MKTNLLKIILLVFLTVDQVLTDIPEFLDDGHDLLLPDDAPQLF